MRAAVLEFKKCRRKHFGLITLFLAGFAFLWIYWGLSSSRADIRNLGYLQCLYQFPVVNAILLPVFAAVLSSRLCDLEYRGGSFKLLLTLQQPGELFRAKLICAGTYLFAAVLLEIGSILLLGMMLDFKSTLPLAGILCFFISQLSVSLFLTLLIQIIALKYANLFIALTVGLAGSFLGLLSMFFPPMVMRLIPSAYYGLLATVAMHYDPATRQVDFSPQPLDRFSLLLLWILTALLYSYGQRMFSRKEV